jgi:hypothetical protein
MASQSQSVIGSSDPKARAEVISGLHAAQQQHAEQWLTHDMPRDRNRTF